MTRRLIIALFFLPFPGLAGDDDMLTRFVVGRYIVVGKLPDANTTYHGKIDITANAGALSLQRLINGNTTVGSAAIEPALHGEATVLHMRFSDAGQQYEQSCLVGADLDNYARISCYTYLPDKRTENPGLEVLFHDHTDR